MVSLCRVKNKNAFSYRKGIFIIIILLIYLSFIYSCAQDVPEKGYEYLAPPTIINVFQNGNTIIVEFRGYNDEYYFDGYNVYISMISHNRSNIQAYIPVQIQGCASCIPSYPLSPDNYDPEKVRRITLYYYYIENEGNYEPYPFSQGKYYIILCSHHRIENLLQESVSNQATLDFE